MSPPKDWDQFGSLLTRGKGVMPGAMFVNLTPLKERVLPATMPAGLFFYLDDDNHICSQAYVCRAYKVHADHAAVDELLRRTPGIHNLMYVQVLSPGPPLWLARFGSISPGTIAYERPFVQPMLVTEILDGLLRPTPAVRLELDPGHWPHRCPYCSGPAYVGLNTVDCQRGCR